jgi:hypothetical protein
MTVAIPIPGGHSKPADPNAVSFLALIPEIRNKIYSHLFEHEDSLWVAGVEKPELYRRPDDHNESLTYTHNSRYSSTSGASYEGEHQRLPCSSL